MTLANARARNERNVSLCAQGIIYKGLKFYPPTTLREPQYLRKRHVGLIETH